MINLLNDEDTRVHGSYHYEEDVSEIEGANMKQVQVPFSITELEGDDMEVYIINVYLPPFTDEWCWHSDNSRDFKDVPECVFETLTEVVLEAANE